MSAHTLRPGHISSLILPLPPSLTFGWLLRLSHLRPRSHPPSLFLMCLLLAPQPRQQAAVNANTAPAACNGPKESCGALSRGHCCPTHRDRGQHCRRVRVVEAHFDCCVILLLCFVVGTMFRYLYDRKSTLVMAKWPTFVHSDHKIHTQRPQLLMQVPTCCNLQIWDPFWLICESQCRLSYKCTKRVQNFS